MKIAVEDVVIGNDRLRKASRVAVKELASSMSTCGQINPITIEMRDGRPFLLAGLHRLEAAKLLNWKEIAAEEFDVSALSKEMAEIFSKTVEVEENLVRARMDAAQQLLFLGRQFKLTGERLAIEKRDRENEAAKGANERRAEALLALKAAKTEKEREARQAEFDDAEKGRVNATRRKSRAGKNVPSAKASCGADGTYKSIPGAIVEVAKALHWRPWKVQKFVALHDAVGDEMLQLMSGTTGATAQQISAFAELKRINPEEADALLIASRKKGWLAGSPQFLLKCAVQDRARREHHGLKDDDEACIAKLREKAVEVSKLLSYMKAVQGKMSADMRYRYKDIVSLFENAGRLVTRLEEETNARKQKRTGQEARYSDEKPGSAEREKARDELKSIQPEVQGILENRAHESGSRVAKH